MKTGFDNWEDCARSYWANYWRRLNFTGANTRKKIKKMKTPEDILFEGYVHAEKGDGATEVTIKAMRKYAEQQNADLKQKLEHNAKGWQEAVKEKDAWKSKFHELELKFHFTEQQLLRRADQE